MTREHRRVFIGLLLGMFVASVSQTIVSPAMPRIVAELGGMDHYSWVATIAMLMSAIVTPIVGKLSDLHGRRRYFLAGLAVFMLGSILSGMAPSFWFLIMSRGVQGIGMGIVMPLSQTIIGDIIPPRYRGKYQGYMGAAFGLSSVVGPLVGGFVTDHLGWRLLFYISLPIGLIAFVVIYRFLQIDHDRREAPIDVAGIVVQSLAIAAILTATSIGGSSYPWMSWQILSLYGVGVALVIAFVFIERRAAEPVIPLRLFRNSVFTLATLATFGVGVMMFGMIIYVPVFAQGVLGVSATESGLLLMPMNLAMILTGVVVGMLITRTGRYKEFTLAGIAVMGVGSYLMMQLDHTSSQWHLSAVMGLFGVGLGGCMQTFLLIVQNAVTRKDLGVATAATQFFRSTGSTVGIAVFGSVMSQRVATELPQHLPPGAADKLGKVDAGAVLDPTLVNQMPEPLVHGLRVGMGAAMHDVFLIGIPFAIAVFIVALMIRAVPLRDTVHTADEAGREYLDQMAQSDGDVPRLPLGRGVGRQRTSERLLGLQLDLLRDQVHRPDRPLLRRAVTDLGDGDLDRGLGLLHRASVMLTSEDPEQVAAAEAYAIEIAERAAKPGGILGDELRDKLAVLAAQRDREEVLTTVEPTIAERYVALDMERLRQASNDLVSVFMLDVEHQRESSPDR